MVVMMMMMMAVTMIIMMLIAMITMLLLMMMGGVAETFRRLLHDEPLVSPHDLLSTQKTLPHGHVEAILLAIRKLGLDAMLSAQRCRERDLVLAMLVEQLLAPCSKLATTRHWHSTTLAEELGVSEATEDELYQAMDWLLERQPRIEKKLADR